MTSLCVSGMLSLAVVVGFRVEKICCCRYHHPAPVALLHLGYMACAPVRPSIAFNISLLQLVDLGSFYMAPNINGWSKTFVALHLKSGFEWTTQVSCTSIADPCSYAQPNRTQDSLRRRLGTALLWYQILMHEKEVYVDRKVSAVAQKLQELKSVNRLSVRCAGFATYSTTTDI